jgi:hypothetical protein
MNPQKLVAILLLIGGTLALVYGGFTYTSDTHKADIGPLHMEVKEKERVNIPLWAGVGAIAFGGLLLVMGGRKS